MDTFNQPKIKALKPESRNQNVVKNCRGFTLIELLVVISTVAVLIALLLPAIQKKREDYAANKATQNLMAMIDASNAYRMRMGSYPNTIAELVQFCGANPGLCSLEPQLASGRTGGYVYSIGPNIRDRIEAEAEPEFAGITGSVTLTMDQNSMLTSIATPGSDDARQRAFDSILASGAATVVQLLNLDSTGAATAQVRGYVGATTVNSGTLTSVFNTLDTNHDGMVNVPEINSFNNTIFDDAALKKPLEGFIAQAYRELRLDKLEGRAGEDIAVTMAELDTTQPSLFSYDGLGNLTSILCNPVNRADALLAKLEAAEAAEANGNLNRKAKFLKQYRTLVKGQIGTSLTSTNANILITISASL